MLLLLLAAELSCELDSRFPDRNTEGKTLQLLADVGGNDMWEMLKLYILIMERKAQSAEEDL